jgi:hypothetical protein
MTGFLRISQMSRADVEVLIEDSVQAVRDYGRAFLEQPDPVPTGRFARAKKVRQLVDLLLQRDGGIGQ